MCRSESTAAESRRAHVRFPRALQTRGVFCLDTRRLPYRRTGTPHRTPRPRQLTRRLASAAATATTPAAATLALPWGTSSLSRSHERSSADQEDLADLLARARHQSRAIARGQLPRARPHGPRSGQGHGVTETCVRRECLSLEERPGCRQLQHRGGKGGHGAAASGLLGVDGRAAAQRPGQAR